MSRSSAAVRHVRTLVVAAVTAAAPLTLAAQSVADAAAPSRDAATSSDSVATTSSATSSVMYQPLAVAAHVAARPDSTASRDRARAALAADRHVGAGQNVALMVVGAAGLITGLVVGGGGGAAIAVGGALVGLYGLYKFVQ